MSPRRLGTTPPATHGTPLTDRPSDWPRELLFKAGLSAAIVTAFESARPELRRSLLAWYGDRGRDLPWRRNRDPYAIWISEIMLQQTQVKTVLPYYDRWLATFPTVEALATANQQQVLKLWQGLGYYARARNLHRAAQIVWEQHQGNFPQDLESVLALPGIGQTTAGGILSAAFNQPQAILDGNVKRVLARLVALPVPPKQAMNALWVLSAELLDRDCPRDFNQAIMDLGATVCTPKQPDCPACPWANHCQADANQRQHELPMTTRRQPLPRKRIGVAVIWNDRQEILIDRRKPEGLLGGMWEFPGGKIEPGESIPDCIKREIQEELALRVAVGDHLTTVEHTYSHFHVELNVHHCRYLGGEPQLLACDEVRWGTLDVVEQGPCPGATGDVSGALRAQPLPACMHA